MTDLSGGPAVRHVSARPRGRSCARSYSSLLLPSLACLLLLTLPVRSALSATRQENAAFLQGHRLEQSAVSTPTTQIVSEGVSWISVELPTADGLQRINLLLVDLANAHVRLGVVQEQNRLLGPGETLSSMAQRTGAVAGINGDYFEMSGTGDALGMVEIDDQIWQSPSSSSVLGITASGRLTIGPEAFFGSVAAGGSRYSLRSINRYSDAGANALALYTPALGATLPLHKADVALLRPLAHSRRVFTVASVQVGATTLPLLTDRAALVGNGPAGSWLLSHLSPGTTLALNERVTPDGGLVEAIGGGAILLSNGVIPQNLSTAPGANIHNPLTAIGLLGPPEKFTTLSP